MKVNLVVASGAHEGKVIPVTGPQFLIGRDAQCHLRPASQAISKRHCGVLIRDGKVYVKDFGSTNGTTVNEELIRGVEVEVESGASVKLGPLDFTVQIERIPSPADGTPLPSANPESAAALAAVTAVTANTPKAPQRDSTPNPARPVKPGGTGSKEAPALPAPKEAAAKPAIKPAPPAQHEDEHDRIAAMLLGMDEEGGEVPDGSTVMEVPVPKPEGQQAAAKEEDKNKKAASREEMTNAASEILRKMMRRPK